MAAIKRAHKHGAFIPITTTKFTQMRRSELSHFDYGNSHNHSALRKVGRTTTIIIRILRNSQRRWQETQLLVLGQNQQNLSNCLSHSTPVGYSKIHSMVLGHSAYKQSTHSSQHLPKIADRPSKSVESWANKTKLRQTKQQIKQSQSEIG